MVLVMILIIIFGDNFDYYIEYDFNDDFYDDYFFKNLRNNTFHGSSLDRREITKQTFRYKCRKIERIEDAKNDERFRKRFEKFTTTMWLDSTTTLFE